MQLNLLVGYLIVALIPLSVCVSGWQTKRIGRHSVVIDSVVTCPNDKLITITLSKCINYSTNYGFVCEVYCDDVF